MSKTPKRPRDPNELAKLIVSLATDDEICEEDSTQQPEKDPNAVALGRKGGLKGGKARAEKLTPEQRKDIAQRAAQKRWEQQKNSP